MRQPLEPRNHFFSDDVADQSRDGVDVGTHSNVLLNGSNVISEPRDDLLFVEAAGGRIQHNLLKSHVQIFRGATYQRMPASPDQEVCDDESSSFIAVHEAMISR
jgi:hypothetical protein